MATNIEIEAKVLIDEKSYEKIKNEYKSCSNCLCIQTNYYIDTKDFKLRENGVALRIRELDGKYAMTLKTPLSEGLLEKTENITDLQFNEMLNNNIFPDNKIRTFLIMLGFKIEELSILTSLQTERIHVDYESGVFSIDKNSYSGKIDFELEKESNNLKDAEAFLVGICQKEHLNYQLNKVSKAARAFDQLKLNK